MKIKFGFFLTLMIAGVIVTNAQGGSRRTVEERVQAVHAKMDSAFKLDTEKQAKADDFQAMREKMQPALDTRDKELKALLTDEQFKKWKEEIEPALIPRRGGGNRQ